MQTANAQWKHLWRRPDTRYEQLFIKGTHIRARTIYGQIMSEEEPRTAECPRTVEDVARDFNIPVEAAKEAVAYCEADPIELKRDYEMEEESIRRMERENKLRKPVAQNSSRSFK